MTAAGPLLRFFRRLPRRALRLVDRMLFPSGCEVCGAPFVEGEETMCLKCRYALPRTGAHLSDPNIIHQRLMSPGVPIERAASWFYYIPASPYAVLIRNAKYNNRPGIARRLGADYAAELLPSGFFDGIDLLIPVPIHWLKKTKRGYNQSEEICRGISQVTGIPIGDNLRAARHSTQTRKTAEERLRNVEGIISVIHPDELRGRHILLVDDVLTTGATMLSCATALTRAVPTALVSVLTLSATRRNC